MIADITLTSTVLGVSRIKVMTTARVTGRALRLALQVTLAECHDRGTSVTRIFQRNGLARDGGTWDITVSTYKD